MIQHIKLYFALSRYVKQLSEELARRFGRRAFYKVENVTLAVQRGGYSTEFIVHAHAAFCSEKDFETHYQSSAAGQSYLPLRRVLARRYFSNQIDFNARMIFDNYGRCQKSSDGFFESGIGLTGTDSH